MPKKKMMIFLNKEHAQADIAYLSSYTETTYPYQKFKGGPTL